MATTLEPETNYGMAESWRGELIQALRAPDSIIFKDVGSGGSQTYVESFPRDLLNQRHAPHAGTDTVFDLIHDRLILYSAIGQSFSNRVGGSPSGTDWMEWMMDVWKRPA